MDPITRHYDYAANAARDLTRAIQRDAYPRWLMEYALVRARAAAEADDPAQGYDSLAETARTVSQLIEPEPDPSAARPPAVPLDGGILLRAPGQITFYVAFDPTDDDGATYIVEAQRHPHTCPVAAATAILALDGRDVPRDDDGITLHLPAVGDEWLQDHAPDGLRVPAQLWWGVSAADGSAEAERIAAAICATGAPRVTPRWTATATAGDEHRPLTVVFRGHRAPELHLRYPRGAYASPEAHLRIVPSSSLLCTEAAVQRWLHAD